MAKHRAAEFLPGIRSLEDKPQSGCLSEAVRAVENTVLQNRGVS